MNFFVFTKLSIFYTKKIEFRDHIIEFYKKSQRNFYTLNKLDKKRV